MSLDDFIDDNELRKDPPSKDKWRYQEPGEAEWEEYFTFDEVEYDGEEMGVISMTMSSDAYIASTDYVNVKKIK